MQVDHYQETIRRLRAPSGGELAGGVGFRVWGLWFISSFGGALRFFLRKRETAREENVVSRKKVVPLLRTLVVALL